MIFKKKNWLLDLLFFMVHKFGNQERFNTVKKVHRFFPHKMFLHDR